MTPQKPLFNASILERELLNHQKNGLTLPVEHLETIRAWSDRISEGLLNRYTETQIEQAFTSAIFVDILGYKPLGASTGMTHIIPKRTASSGHDVPDFVLGAFDAGTRLERWKAVGEIKGLHVNLDRPQTSRHHRETPVQQAFRYALNGEPGVEWVLVTNFREIRLYRNGFTGAFHRWLLEELRDASRLYEFWILLRQPHLAPESGTSETLRIFNKSISAGLALTEGFYGLYDLARQKLIKEFLHQPAFKGADPHVLYGKAHKVLNRVLFAAFCEDHPAELLPAGTLRRLHEQASALKQKNTYWSVFKDFFEELDKGSAPGSPHAFHAFNGGLFAPDSHIDSLKLPDSLFKEPLVFKARGKESRRIEGIFGFHVYDFAEELDVDSLGSIFEQSLKDLPTKSRSVRGHGIVELTRRETTGVYYTPPAITGYLVSRSLKYLLDPIKSSLVKEADSKQFKTRKSKKSLSAEDERDVYFLRKLMERLDNMTLIDPACGSGAFLIQAFHQLHAEYESVSSALAQLKSADLLPGFGLDRLILRKNIHGIDILGESVEISKLSLWLRTASKTEPLERLDKTIKCADALRASGREKFDIVISNPPWGAELEDWSDEQIRERFPQCGSEKDTAAMFVIRAWELLTPGGVLAFVTPNSWLTVEGYEPFRRWLLNAFEILEIVNLWKIFKDVNHDVCLLIARKPAADSEKSPTKIHALERGLSEDEKNQQLAEERWAFSFEAAPEAWLKEPATRFETIYPPSIAAELDTIAKRCQPLGEMFDVTVGIQVYHQRKVSREIIETQAFHSTHRKGIHWHPYINGNEVQRYFSVPEPNAFLLYSDALCDKRELDHYTKPRILVQQIFWNKLSAHLDYPTEPLLYLNTLFSISAPKSKLDLPGLLVILNSRFVSAAYERWANRLFGDKFPKVSKIDLARLPIPVLSAKKDIDPLNALGSQLSNSWDNLKSMTTGYAQFLKTLDPSENLWRDLRNFWAISRNDLTTALHKRVKQTPAGVVKSLIDTWSETHKKAGSLWARISKAEAEAEELVKRLYRVGDRAYSALITRAPEPRFEDILLPKKHD